MRIHLSDYPSYAKTYLKDFPKLDGGLNIRELNYRLEADQSPSMKNLWWQDGVLQSRDGQEYLSEDASLGTGYACFEELFWNRAFFHIGDGIWCAEVFDGQTAEEFDLVRLTGGVPENRGTFFRYGDCLYYKNRGGFLRISYGASSDSFAAEDLTDPETAYVPVILINAEPSSGSGDLYQPENRLSPRKTVRYNAAEGVTVYHLPVAPVEAVTSVRVDGREKGTSTYSVSLANGTVTFKAAPDAGSGVEITYSLANEAGRAALLSCRYAAVAGGGDGLCMLLAGCEGQPNAVFWNGNDSFSMNDSYFPVSFYNLVGDAEDPVTGFGKQYGDLLVFQENSVGKLAFSLEEVEGRDSVSFTYQTVNAKTGCDLPWSIRLIENNLVFCNTRRGVHIVRSASAAYENNVERLSENVNGSGGPGLLGDVRGPGTVASLDDGSRYWLAAGEHVYLWDYSVSTAAKPSWFYFAGVNGIAYLRDGAGTLYHLDAAGRITRFSRVFKDYGEAIDKTYTFPTQYFGSYDRLKDILYLLVTVRSDTDTEVKLRYDTDYEQRADLTPITSYVWKLWPRDLSRRCLSSYRYGKVAKRKPGCRHVRHFSLTLSNNRAGEDLAIVSAQIYYRYQGKER